MKKSIFMLLLVLLSPAIYAWDSSGHRIVAQIAYDELTPTAKRAVNHLTESLDRQYSPRSRFLYGSEWPDILVSDDVTAFNTWHYINVPWSIDGTPVPATDSENVVWAVGQTEKTLESQKSNPQEKAIALRFLVHFVGDVHQPLHAIERIDRQHPSGDEGGNLYPIQSQYANNLHSYWDHGLGLYMERTHEGLSNNQISKFANHLESMYPQSYFGAKISDNNPKDWAQESFTLAKNAVYSIPENTQPSAEYVHDGQAIVEQRLALSGYRLAYFLNKTFQ